MPVVMHLLSTDLRTVSPVDRAVAEEQLPAVLNFSPCRTHVSMVDGLLLLSPNVPSPAEAVIDSHKQALNAEGISEAQSKFDHVLVDDQLVDKNAGLAAAGCAATGFANFIDASDDKRASNVRSSTDFFCRAQPLIIGIGTSDARWTSSTAFSGIGCPELASSALAYALDRD